MCRPYGTTQHSVTWFIVAQGYRVVVVVVGAAAAAAFAAFAAEEKKQ